MRGRLITIAVGALLALMTLSTPAHAQTQPLYRNWDENGVDLVQGDFELSFEEGSIGSGPAELSLVRVTGGGQATSQWDRIFFEQTNPGGVLRTIIGLPHGRYEIFTGPTFINTKGNGGTLTHGDLSYTYTSPEGTTITFV